MGITLHNVREKNFAPILRKEGEAASVWTLMQNEQPGWPGTYGHWQATAFDFKALDKFATSGSPAMLDVVGQGFRGKKQKPPKRQPRLPPPPSLAELRTSRGVDYTFAEMTAPKFAGKNVHLPPLTGKPAASGKMAKEHAMTKHVPGLGEGEAELADVLVAWFKDRLDSPNGRAPIPEIWPAMRVIDGPREVSMVVPRGAITVHYTTDGTDPTTASPVYQHPFTIEGDTVVKARSVMPNRQDSGVAVATFVTGPVPPRCLQTERALPPGQTGQAYSFTFQLAPPAAADSARFWLKEI